MGSRPEAWQFPAQAPLPALLFALSEPYLEVFGWLKRRVKQSQPDGAQDLFDVLELGQAELSEDHVAAFFRHMVSYIPACIQRERITK